MVVRSCPDNASYVKWYVVVWCTDFVDVVASGAAVDIIKRFSLDLVGSTALWLGDMPAIVLYAPSGAHNLFGLHVKLKES